MDRAILEAVVYKDIAEEIHAPLKKSDNVWQNTGKELQEVFEIGGKWNGVETRVENSFEQN